MGNFSFSRNQVIKCAAIFTLLVLYHQARRYKPDLSDDPPIACVDFHARLGNLMFMYAFLFSVSKIKGLTQVIPENFELAEVFEINNRTLPSIGRDFRDCKRAPVYEERWPCGFDSDMWDVPAKKSVRFYGYFQSWKYWIRFEKELREEFTFKQRIKSKAMMQFQHILQKFNFTDFSRDTVVSVHLRRGDYLTRKDIRYGKTTPGLSYYLRAMQFFKKRYRRVMFIVSSNSIEWAKHEFRSEPFIYFSEGNSPAVDMALLSLANHTIMSVGTFGWFISWLTQGTTIYYKHLFVPGSGYSRDFRNNDINEFIYPGWIGMS